MKKSILFTFLLMPILVNGQCCLTDGMTWRIEVHGGVPPEHIVTTEIVSIEQIEDEGCFNVYCTDIDESPTPELLAVLQVDGDKVFFKPVWSVTSEWYLAYDFGLKPGEGCYVYDLSDKGIYHDIPYCSYVKCVSIEEPSEEGGWSMMTLEESGDPDSFTYGQGKWIKGLSSFRGLLYNNGFDLCGIGYKLIEVSVNGETIYLNESAGNAEISDSSSPDIRVEGSDIRVSTDGDVRGSLYSGAGTHIGDYRFGKIPTYIRVPDSGVYILRIGDVPRKIFIP